MDIVNPVSESPESPPPVVVDQTKAGVLQSNLPSGISTLAELKIAAPPLYDAIMMAIAMEVRRQQEASLKRMKDELRKQREK